MQLVFKKNDAGDVAVTMFKGTAEIQFSYIEMIKALIAGESLDTDFSETISDEEKKQIEEVIQEIETITMSKEEDTENREANNIDFYD